MMPAEAACVSGGALRPELSHRTRSRALDMLAEQRSYASRPTSGTERPRQIFRASLSGISEWRGTASTAPVWGL